MKYTDSILASFPALSGVWLVEAPSAYFWLIFQSGSHRGKTLIHTSVKNEPNLNLLSSHSKVQVETTS
jgi:hypothetical protein